jgi:2-keto-4-pentenoate hydratase/2-oxohepta-3-ene-1,7-dioic acid hydratase in catechol pathway
MITRPTLVNVVVSGIISAIAVVSSAADGQVTKYLRFRNGKTTAYGMLEGDQVRQLSGNLLGRWEKTDKTYPLSEVKILTPIGRPSKVLALAGNYKDHLGDRPIPKDPEPFFKPSSCLLDHEGEIVQPKSHEPVHYEAELVVVIGKRARKVSEAEALQYVLGVTCGNDISARYWQSNDRQWWRAKGMDTFGPCGPFIVSGLDLNNLAMELRVNGEVRQKTNTKNMIHNVAQTISFISQHMTLLPGDLIYTGTPGQTQPLKPGDEVEVEIEGVGVLKNHVVAEK